MRRSKEEREEKRMGPLDLMEGWILRLLVVVFVLALGMKIVGVWYSILTTRRAEEEKYSGRNFEKIVEDETKDAKVQTNEQWGIWRLVING